MPIQNSIPVITTATDVNGRFAVDEWAKRQNCAVKNPDRIVAVSSKVLAGEEILVQSDWPVAEEAPEFVRQTAASSSVPDVVVSIRRQGSIFFQKGLRDDVWREKADDSQQPASEASLRDAAATFKLPLPLQLIPRIAVLGIGCRKGTDAAHLESCFSQFMKDNGMEEAAVCAAASIDLKKKEPGLKAFCEKHGIPFQTYLAEQLRAVEGDFTPSRFVQEITGVDNVCERSAVLAAGGGELLIHKTKYDGVTMALAVRPYLPDWCWR